MNVKRCLLAVLALSAISTVASAQQVRTRPYYQYYNFGPASSTQVIRLRHGQVYRNGGVTIYRPSYNPWPYGYGSGYSWPYGYGNTMWLTPRGVNPDSHHRRRWR